ncbi:MAG: hypothetical protein ACKO5M_01065, partial [Vulcanococcus sp.]
MPSTTTTLLQDSLRLQARLQEVPAEPGCYLMRDGEDRILYIGKAKVLRRRGRRRGAAGPAPPAGRVPHR